MLIANMLVQIKCEDDRILFQSSLKSIYPVCDEIFLLDTSEEKNLVKSLIPATYIDKVRVASAPPDICYKEGFDVARNLMLPQVPIGAHILWVDSDEVHFSGQLQSIKDLLLSKYDDISTHFIHFCINSNRYEKFERRINIFRKKSEECRWVGHVHERIEHGAGSRSLYHSDYIYHHYGYIRPQEVIYDRWYQYALLEGQKNPSVEQEYPDKQVLDHRRASLLPYFGEYPKHIPLKWIESKMDQS